MPERLRQLEDWLEQSCGLARFDIAPASADASFRRYFRVSTDDGKTLIAMDAPPEKEDSRPFVGLAAQLAAAGLHVPEIHAQDLRQGFLLLEDLGSTSYLDVLDEQRADALYTDAIDAILQMQRGVDPGELPSFDRAMLLREMQLFPDWLLQRHLGLTLDAAESRMLETVFEHLVASALTQPQVCVHRDFHSRNLMCVPIHNPGIIDFQDAVCGPLSYDLVSLLRDCYIRWPAERVQAWVTAYLSRADGLANDIGLTQFTEWFDLMGVQRHLKAAGIFARLNHRDGKIGYMADIPRTLNYIVDIGATRASVEPLADLIAGRVLPRLS